jgi:hypothetical protein
MALVSAALFILVALPDFDPGNADFKAFHESATLLRDGWSPYLVTWRPNMNPPWFSALLWPWTWLSLPWAFVAWTALNVTIAALTVRWIHKARGIPLVPLVIGCIILPAWIAWCHGQVTWLLMFCITGAWLSRSHVAAGLWLAPAIMLKPPLALMAILLPWPVTLVAGGGSFLGTLLLVPVFGVQMWAHWLTMFGRVDWLGVPGNASLWGQAARWSTGASNGAGLDDLSSVTVGLVLAVAILLALMVRRAEGDRRWSLAFLWSLLLSPLGWLYYLPAGLGSIVASMRWSRWGVAAVALLFFPPTILHTWGYQHGWFAVGVSAMTGAAILCLWIDISRG